MAEGFLTREAGRAGGLRRPRRRALRVRHALARGSRARRGGGPGHVPAGLARRRPLRPRARLPSHLAVRDPSQRGHRHRPRPRGAAHGRRRDAGAWATSPSRRSCSPGRWRRRCGGSASSIAGCWSRPTCAAAPTPRSPRELGVPGGNDQEPRLLRAAGRSETRSRRWAMTAEGCRDWRERIGALVLGQLDPDERAATEAHLDGLPRLPRRGRRARAGGRHALARRSRATRPDPGPARAPRRPHRPADRGRAPRRAPQARAAGAGAAAAVAAAAAAALLIAVVVGGLLERSTSRDRGLPRAPARRLGTGHASSPGHGEARQRSGPRLPPGHAVHGLAAPRRRHQGRGRLVPLRLRRRERRGRPELGRDPGRRDRRSACAPARRPSWRRCRPARPAPNDALS